MHTSSICGMQGTTDLASGGVPRRELSVLIKVVASQNFQLQKFIKKFCRILSLVGKMPCNNCSHTVSLYGILLYLHICTSTHSLKFLFSFYSFILGVSHLGSCMFVLDCNS